MRARDHPRSRGVYHPRRPQTTQSLGSSPLARGLRILLDSGKHLVGIIPARAGFTSTRTRMPTPTWDHPRSRGVYGSELRIRVADTGSSPLARGLRQHAPLESSQRGIIPARAGFTQAVPSQYQTQPDHPRSRGVYRYVSFICQYVNGSSPLARGLLQYRTLARHVSRIIPARAGFTSPRSPGRPVSPDHPRSRGVY